jgi:hypothetical protein
VSEKLASCLRSVRVCSWSRSDFGCDVRTAGPALWQEGRGRFRRVSAAVFLTGSRNNGSRALNKFTAGSNALTVSRFHKIYGRGCQGHGDKCDGGHY